MSMHVTKSKAALELQHLAAVNVVEALMAVATDEHGYPVAFQI